MTYLCCPHWQAMKVALQIGLTRMRSGQARRTSKVASHPRKLPRATPTVPTKAKERADSTGPERPPIPNSSGRSNLFWVQFLVLASKVQNAPDSMGARCRDATRIILKLKTSDQSIHQLMFHRVATNASSMLWQLDLPVQTALRNRS